VQDEHAWSKETVPALHSGRAALHQARHVTDAAADGRQDCARVPATLRTATFAAAAAAAARRQGFGHLPKSTTVPYVFQVCKSSWQA
jgi:hypothetical protein